MAENQEPSFEELLKESEARSVSRVEPGQKLAGKVVSISKGTAFVDVGMRSEAAMPLNPEDERCQELAEDDDITVYVTSAKGQVEVSLDPALGYGDFSVPQEAFENEKPVEGKINKVIPGGYEVNIAGVRCFCPFSQLNLHRGREKQPEQHIGQTYEFKVIELDARRTNVVLSRRALLEEAMQRQLEETRAKLDVGVVMTGKVVSIHSFGAFIDLGGIQGLLHISELDHQNVPTVEDAVALDDEVEVKVLDITQDSKGKERISLSRKALMPDPWDTLEIKPGDRIQGQVARKSRFGVFITLSPGADGLLPRRLMKQAGRDVDMEQFTEGETLEIEVVEVDREGRKATLALPGWDEELKSEISVGETLAVEVIKVIPAGVLVQCVDDPARGLIPKRTLKHGSMKQINDAFPPGSRHEAVLEERDSRGRFNFALKSGDELDRESAAEFMGQSKSLGHNPFASFFDKS